MNDNMNWRKFLNKLVQYEKLETKAYQDVVGVWTIGIGSIRHPDGTPVKKGDVITEAQAYEWAEKEARGMFEQLRGMLKVEQNEGQLIALLCLMYNIGVAGLKGSSVLRSINNKAPLSEIEQNWYKWNKGHKNGQLVEIPGLTIRRKSEFKVYSGIVVL